jgi:hypothetical protein
MHGFGVYGEFGWTCSRLHTRRRISSRVECRALGRTTKVKSAWLSPPLFTFLPPLLPPAHPRPNTTAPSPGESLGARRVFAIALPGGSRLSNCTVVVDRVPIRAPRPAAAPLHPASCRSMSNPTIAEATLHIAICKSPKISPKLGTAYDVPLKTLHTHGTGFHRSPLDNAINL